MEFWRERDRQTWFNPCRLRSSVPGLVVVQQCPLMSESLHKLWNWNKEQHLSYAKKLYLPLMQTCSYKHKNVSSFHINQAQKLKRITLSCHLQICSKFPASQAKLLFWNSLLLCWLNLFTPPTLYPPLHVWDWNWNQMGHSHTTCFFI